MSFTMAISYATRTVVTCNVMLRSDGHVTCTYVIGLRITCERGGV
jgi:hypothetical protein